MGLNISRFVEIHFSNNTQNITLKNTSTYFSSGYSLNAPNSAIPPGSSSTFKFTNSSWFWGCNGVLAFEADTFTLAIYFSNPIDYNRFSGEMGLELSLEKGQHGNLEETYSRLVSISCGSSGGNPSFPSVILKENQEQVQLSDGPIKVTATMHGIRNAVIRVELEEQRSSGGEDGQEIPCRPRRAHEK